MADHPSDPDDPEGPLSPADESAAVEEMARRAGAAGVNLFEGVREAAPDAVLPVRLKADDMFCFSCHRGVSCWNACCHDADVMLTPYDILRLSRRLTIRPGEFVDRYAFESEWERAGLPMARLRMRGEDGKGACVLLDGDAGCGVYADRPVTCRYYPLGLGTVKLKDADGTLDFHFLVKEAHCKGHDEDKLQTVAAYRTEQGVEDYDAVNRGWMEILMKMVSWRSVGGPHGRQVAERTKQMFYMVSTDVDTFRRFVFDTRFLDIYQIDADRAAQLETSDEALLALGFDWLKNVLFNEPTLEIKTEVLQQGVARARDEYGGA